MIPEFNQSGVLPPFLPGCTPSSNSAVSPYKTTLLEIINHFSTSDDRKKILHGFLNYRIHLKKLGFNDGFQWIDGSFVENIEKTKNRSPNDIDLVTFAHRPDKHKEDDKWGIFVQNESILHPGQQKNMYLCDAYLVDLNLSSRIIVSQTRYWFGLFSHQRESYLWKGMLEVDLGEDEYVALQLLNQEVQSAS